MSYSREKTEARRAAMLRSMRNRRTLTTGHVALVAEVAPRTVSKWFDGGKLPGYRIPGSQDRRFKRTDVQNFLKANGMPLGPLAGGAFRVMLVGCPAGTAETISGLLTAMDREAAELLEAATTFDAGAMCQERRPDAVAVWGRIGRAEMVRAAEFFESFDAGADVQLVAIVGEDGGGAADARAAGYSDVWQEPLDVAALVKWVKEVVNVPDPMRVRKRRPGKTD